MLHALLRALVLFCLHQLQNELYICRFQQPHTMSNQHGASQAKTARSGLLQTLPDRSRPTQQCRSVEIN